MELYVKNLQSNYFGHRELINFHAPETIDLVPTLAQRLRL